MNHPLERRFILSHINLLTLAIFSQSLNYALITDEIIAILQAVYEFLTLYLYRKLRRRAHPSASGGATCKELRNDFFYHRMKLL